MSTHPSSTVFFAALMSLWLWVPVSPAAELTKLEKQQGFVSLFNGKNLDGWIGATDGYAAKDGVLVCLKGKGGNLLTKDEYRDFVFRFEFNLEPAANNGVGIRTPLEGNLSYTGMEIQILDDSHEKYKDVLKDYQMHGSLYGVVPARRGFLKPAGQWNREEIRCQGRTLTVTLNDQVILQANLDEVKPVDGQEHPGLKNEKGHLGFLGHDDQLQFRNIRIKTLDSSAESSYEEATAGVASGVVSRQPKRWQTIRSWHLFRNSPRTR